MRKWILALVLTLAPLPALAAGVHVTDAWFRMLPAGLPAGGYFVLHNGGARALTITGAQSPACTSIMLHRSTEKNGVSQMIRVPQVSVAAGGTLRFTPGGYHLMCMHPKTNKMKIGGHVPVVLRSANGYRLRISFQVRGARGHYPH